MVYGSEDVDDDIVDVEGEENVAVTEEEPEEEKPVTTSKDADTTILFTEPVHNPLSTLGKLFISSAFSQSLNFISRIKTLKCKLCVCASRTACLSME